MRSSSSSPCRRTACGRCCARRRRTSTPAPWCSAPPRASRTARCCACRRSSAEEWPHVRRRRGAVRAELRRRAGAVDADGGRRRLAARATPCGHVQEEFRSGALRLYASTDVVGVELGGALKNVIAIAAGVVDGLRPRPQRPGRAHHPRAGRDLAAGRGGRRRPRDAGRPGRHGRPGADLHRAAQSQPPRRRRPGATGAT